MNQIIFLDTETTGLDDKARLVQLAYKVGETGQPVNLFFRPPAPISFEAMAVHHITNEFVENAKPFFSSSEKIELQKLLENGILVAHNAKFDIKILANEGLTVRNFICTEKIARHLIESDSYQLQYLRYSLGLDKMLGQAAPAHDAAGDIIVLEALFSYLIDQAAKAGWVDSMAAQMVELSNKPVLLKKIDFGKYKGMPFNILFASDPNYLQWLLRQEFVQENENLCFTINHYLAKS